MRQLSSSAYDFKHWDSLPKVVCGCPTFGRPMGLLNETVESFLLQDYPGEKELIIFNDCSLVELRCDCPEVKIINYKDRHKSLGHKFNAMMEVGYYDVWAYWNDDDIYLPHAISTAIANMVNHKFYVPGKRIFALGNKIIRVVNQAMGSPWVCTRDFWEKMGGYKTDIIGIDYDFCGRARIDIDEWTDKEMKPEQIYFLYRWATGSYHASSRGPHPEHYDNIGKKIFSTISPGTYHITPKWDNDYEALVSSFLKIEC